VRREAEERRQHELEELERRRLAQIEQERADRLAGEVSAWRLASDVREYVTALRERVAGAELDEEARARVLEWCTWAESWASRSDPVQNLERVKGLVLEHESSEATSTPPRSPFARSHAASPEASSSESGAPRSRITSGV
jgi:hypothetical protein